MNGLLCFLALIELNGFIQGLIKLELDSPSYLRPQYSNVITAVVDAMQRRLQLFLQG
jgi:hypothetical protein